MSTQETLSLLQSRYAQLTEDLKNGYQDIVAIQLSRIASQEKEILDLKVQILELRGTIRRLLRKETLNERLYGQSSRRASPQYNRPETEEFTQEIKAFEEFLSEKSSSTASPTFMNHASSSANHASSTTFEEWRPLVPRRDGSDYSDYQSQRQKPGHIPMLSFTSSHFGESSVPLEIFGPAFDAGATISTERASSERPLARDYVISARTSRSTLRSLKTPTRPKSPRRSDRTIDPRPLPRPPGRDFEVRPLTMGSSKSMTAIREPRRQSRTPSLIELRGPMSAPGTRVNSMTSVKTLRATIMEKEKVLKAKSESLRSLKKSKLPVRKRFGNSLSNIRGGGEKAESRRGSWGRLWRKATGMN